MEYHLPQSVAPYVALVDTPLKLVSTSILILIIVYSSVIPAQYKNLANSLFGRLLGIATVYGVIHYMGWIHGLLTAMAFLLLLHGGVGLVDEGFDGGGTVSEKKTIGNRWWIEKVLGEMPTAIATDRVTTGAPGDTSG